MLHMYKCCIEISLVCLVLHLLQVLHMYKCCIEIIRSLKSIKAKIKAPHVQMLYWNQISKDVIDKIFGSTCTNVVLK